MIYKQLQTFVTLLWRDARVFKRYTLNRLIDACVWSGTTLYISQYVLVKFGISSQFASFLILGNIASWGMFEVGSSISIILSDLQGANSLSYYLSLPVPSSWIFIRIGLMDAYKTFISTLPMIPIGKLILGNNILLSSINYPKLIVSYILAHLFFGFLGLFVASITPSLEYLSTVKMRILFPMWFLGCYQFTWHMLYETNPTLAYLNLLNPVTYIVEGMRGSLDLNLPLLSYPVCVAATSIFIILFAWAGVRNFKRRVDCL